MKKSYKGFPAYLFIVFGVMMASQLFTSMMNPNRGSKIGYSEMLAYIEQGVISHVAVEQDTVYARMSESKIPEEHTAWLHWQVYALQVPSRKVSISRAGQGEDLSRILEESKGGRPSKATG